MILFRVLPRKLKRHKPHKAFSVGKKKKRGRNKGETRITAEAHVCACSESDRRVPFPGTSYQSLSSLKVTDQGNYTLISTVLAHLQLDTVVPYFLL